MKRALQVMILAFVMLAGWWMSLDAHAFHGTWGALG